MTDTKMTINDLLKERGGTHGVFAIQARTTQDIKDILHSSPNWHRMTAGQHEALESVAIKLGRMVCGDHNYADHVDDIIGYLRLYQEVLPK